ncbi:SMP-30/gluconolactonase/LRE family protein [Microbulbifer halophilus]|uniref:SMP-30/gluconolactonase/LRE family protein n=1 Tax=Microbulbifer halophilus TaxID=453963 RepID=A0ABW5EJ23_9GAMM|nr:SMP-30/gluconolactonase/LRE family protein [Microbulbifer halophilus]MCW8127598.1 SMP-30/gluconolactonase/LRE family protein [Microbulbifer halophilus]
MTDKVKSGSTGEVPISITSDRKYQVVAPGECFSPITLTVSKDGKPVKEGIEVTLSVVPQGHAWFRDGQSINKVRTNASGQIVIERLKAAANLRLHDSFEVMAKTSGLDTPVPVFKGEAPPMATSFYAIDDKEEAVVVEQLFQNKLRVKVEGIGAIVGSDVIFSIEAGNRSAFFVERKNETKKDIYYAKVGNDGIAEAHLQALDVPGTVKVEANVPNGLNPSGHPITFKDREVKPAPKVSGIQKIADTGEAVFTGQAFANKLQVKVEGSGIGGTKVKFKITAGNYSAFFIESKGETHKDEYLVSIDDSGIAGVHLQALAVPGTVTVQAWSLIDPSPVKTVTFQDREVKPVPTLDIKLPAGARPDGVAVARDGTAWVAGRVGDAGAVFCIAPGEDSKPLSYTLPAGVPPARGHQHPSHIALEIKQDGGVAAVWVSDVRTGFVYRLVPGDADGHKADKIDLGAGSVLRGIAWDEKRKLVWVADERGRLLAIDTEKKAENKGLAASHPSSGISDVAVAGDRVWFTEYAAGQVCFLDASKKADAADRIKAFDFKITTKDEVGNTLPTSYPSGLAVAGDRIWIVTGFADSAEGSLWAIDTIASDPITPLQHVTDFGKNTQPSDIAVDEVGYLWVTLSGTHKLVQLADTGLYVDQYDLGEQGVPTAIACTHGLQDQIWICDAQKDNPRVVRLTPIDQILPASEGKVHISGQPEWGFVAQGQPLQALTVKVADDRGKPLERHVILNVDPVETASFGGKNYTVVKTDKATGQATVKSLLKVAAGAAKGDKFTVHAETRGTPRNTSGKPLVYEGFVGEPITEVRLVNDKPETVALGTNFQNLEAQLVGPGGANADVIFKIEKGARSAAFTQAKGTSEYSTKAGQDGIARAGLHALDQAGDVSVSVRPKVVGDRLSARFEPRHVVPIPDKIEGDKTMRIPVGEPSQLYTIKVVAGGIPVPNVVVQVFIRPVAAEAAGVHFKQKGKLDNPDLKEVRIRTDGNGQASIGDGAEWFILCPNPGHVNVRFEVIEPVSATQASLEFSANVEREAVV